MTPAVKKTIPINITVDLEKDEVHVNPNPFYIDSVKQEEVQWVFAPPAGHPEIDCFTVYFPNASPFEETTFGHHRDHTGCARMNAVHNKLYDATLTVPGVGTCMIQGGVKP